MNSIHRQSEDTIQAKWYTRAAFSSRTQSLPNTAPLIDIGLMKTHGKCLPFDIQFQPIQVDNMVFHFPLPPSPKPSLQEASPADSAVHMPDLLTEMSNSIEGETNKKTQRRTRKTASTHTKRKLPMFGHRLWICSHATHRYRQTTRLRSHQTCAA